MKYKLSIIIVSWNVRDDLERCLASLFTYIKRESFEVWVVDNASHDGSVDMVEQKFPHVNLIRNNTNVGFGKANNQALEYTSGEYVLFLNDDTYIDSDISALIDEWARPEHKTLGMLGVQLRNTDGSIQPSVRAFPTLRDQLAIALKLHRIFPGIIARYLQQEFDYTKPAFVDQVMGAFMVMPRAVLEQVGAFDEDFFTWFEEVDLQRRVQQADYQVLYTPDYWCYHVGGASFSQLRRAKAQWMFMNSMATYFRKQHGYISYSIIRIIQPISVLLAYAYQSIHRLVNRTR